MQGTSMQAAVGNVGGTLDLRRQIKRCAECAQTFSHDAMFCPFDGTKLDFAPWDPTGDPLLKQVIDGRYEVVGVLGEGGMGTVYDVVHTALHRHFAMKVLRRDLAREADLAARFMTEARATASIKHPNIVAISDFGRMDGGVPYFVMELLVGQTLSQSIKHGGPIPASRGIRIVLQVAAALGAAHKARVVHRDLKPENIFLLGKADTARDDVRVVDFGAAMILGASRVTKAGIVFGTPHYMSPEQASGQPVDHRADIYALGIIMYEMFTGKVPFEADTYMGVLTQHMFVQPVPPSQASPYARELGALEGVTLRALEKKPEHRYETMEQLAEEIQRVVTFTADGGVRIAGSARLSKPAPSFKLADELELPSSHEIGAELTALSMRRRRARAQRGVAYGAILIAVAAVCVVAMRFFGGSPASESRDAITPAPATSSIQAAAGGNSAAGGTSAAGGASAVADGSASSAPPAAASAPTSTPSSESASASTAPAFVPQAAAVSAPAPTAEKKAGSRNAGTAVPPKKGASPSSQTRPGLGDFADPWAK